jgi:hypothetical protein
VRDRELLDLAQREASGWFDRTKPAAAAVERILASWASRFKLIDVA